MAGIAAVIHRMAGVAEIQAALLKAESAKPPKT
jgi:hypothetical protein